MVLKKVKFKVKDWEMYESKRTQDENIDIFKTVKRLFDLENPKHSPVFTEFRTQAKKKAIDIYNYDKANQIYY